MHYDEVKLSKTGRSPAPAVEWEQLADGLRTELDFALLTWAERLLPADTASAPAKSDVPSNAIPPLTPGFIRAAAAFGFAVILRGMPGSGKSTFAKYLHEDVFGRGASVIFSADDILNYPSPPGPQEDVERCRTEALQRPEISQEDIAASHEKCRRAFNEAVGKVRIVDNTHCERREYAHYIDGAQRSAVAARGHDEVRAVLSADEAASRHFMGAGPPKNYIMSLSFRCGRRGMRTAGPS